MKTLMQTLNIVKNSVKDSAIIEKLNNLEEDFRKLRTKSGLKGLVRRKKLRKIIKEVEYEEELEKLQIEMIKLQNWIYDNKKRIMIIFEGRDAAGKGGAIKRFTEHLNPRKYRVVALPKPTDVESGQFYFQRYFQHLPNPGEIVFFDRSWYNRAIVEPVFGFCTKEQYKKFIREVPEMENALIDDGIILIKFWFSISKETQKRRFEERMTNPLKQWKLSPIDKKAQDLWNKITYYKEEMFSKTHTSYSPWIIVNSNNKKIARLESIKYILSLLQYEGKKEAKIALHPDPDIVQRYHRSSLQVD